MKKTQFFYFGSILLAVFYCAIVGTIPATAHAEVVSSDPAPGAQLSESPQQIRITFSEPVEPQTTFVILDTKFNGIEGVEPQVDPDHQDQVYSTLPLLDPGVYTVQWNAVTDDGGKTSGIFSFSVVETSSLRPAVLVLEILLALIVLLAVIWAVKKRVSS